MMSVCAYLDCIRESLIGATEIGEWRPTIDDVI